MEAETGGRRRGWRWGWVGWHCGHGHDHRPGWDKAPLDHPVSGPAGRSRTSPTAPGSRSLADLEPGEVGQIVTLGCARALTRRLADLGFIPGASVRVVRRFAGGRLIQVSLRGWRLALRRSEAREVLVR